MVETRLRDLREDRDLTQRELGGYLGAYQTTYSDYEPWRLNIPLRTLCRIADYYGVSTDYPPAPHLGAQAIGLKPRTVRTDCPELLWILAQSARLSSGRPIEPGPRVYFWNTSTGAPAASSLSLASSIAAASCSSSSSQYVLRRPDGPSAPGAGLGLFAPIRSGKLLHRQLFASAEVIIIIVEGLIGSGKSLCLDDGKGQNVA